MKRTKRETLDTSKTHTRPQVLHAQRNDRKQFVEVSPFCSFPTRHRMVRIHSVSLLCLESPMCLQGPGRWHAALIGGGGGGGRGFGV